MQLCKVLYLIPMLLLLGIKSPQEPLVVVDKPKPLVTVIKTVEPIVVAKTEVRTPVVARERLSLHEQWTKDAGIDLANFKYVDYIVNHESSWIPSVKNNIGACGLVQIYPCSKFNGAWDNPVENLKWGNNYAISRYGSWKNAYYFWQRNRWW